MTADCEDLETLKIHRSFCLSYSAGLAGNIDIFITDIDVSKKQNLTYKSIKAKLNQKR